MAMIKCPNCGRDISSKAISCPGCGISIFQENFVTDDSPAIICEECGTIIPEGATNCPSCGCPVESAENDASLNEPQKVEITKISLKQSTKKIIIAIIALIVSIAVIIGILSIIDAKKAEDARIAAEEEATELSETYNNNLKQIRLSILSGAADAETACNLIKSVWYNSIYEKNDYTTDKYTKSNNGRGYFYSDFNDALQNLFADSDFKTKLSKIEKNQDQVSAIMKKLINPPAEYKEAYDVCKQLYDAYLQLTNLAVSPSGNLSSFSSTFSSADDDVMKYYNSLEMYLD